MRIIPDKQCFTISEVANILGENASTVRFWSDRFPKWVKPDRNANGNRLYHRADVENLKKIHYYVKERRLTLEGVDKIMNVNAGGTDNRVEVVERLKNVRSILIKIRENL